MFSNHYQTQKYFSKPKFNKSELVFFLVLKTQMFERSHHTCSSWGFFMAQVFPESLKDWQELPSHFPELYKVKEVQKKFKWVDAQLKLKVPLSPLAPEVESGELLTLVARQLIWTSF